MKTAPIELKIQSTTPSTPDSGYNKLYASTSAAIAFVDASGVSHNIDGITPQGNYNANTNSPDISSPTIGDIYKVTTAGDYDINGDGTKATHAGTNDLSSGYNFDSSHKDFWVSVNGGSTTQIDLDSTCTTLGQIVTEINSETSQAGVSGIEAYAIGTSSVGIRTLLTGADKTVTLYSGTNDALTILGLTSGTATGANGSDVDCRVGDVLIYNNNSSWIHIKNPDQWKDVVNEQVNIADNTTTASIFLGSITTYRSFGIKATADDGTLHATFPEFFITHDGTTAIVESLPSFIGNDFSTSLSLDATISSGDAYLNFVSSSHGSTIKFRYDITTYIEVST